MGGKYIWVYSPKPAKLTEYDKKSILNKVSEYVKNSEKLNGVVNRTAIKAGRLYLYNLIEAYGWDNPEIKRSITLIDGRYKEFPLARIMLTDKKGEKCILDWQRHNAEWMTLHEGNLEECLKFIEEDEWFEGNIGLNTSK